MNEVEYSWRIIMTDRDSQEIDVHGYVNAATFQSALDQARGASIAAASDGTAGEPCKGPYRIIHMVLTRSDAV